MTNVYVAKTDFLKDRRVFQHFYQLAPLFRKEKIDRLLNEETKHLSLAAWMLVSHALEKEGINAETTPFGQNENGKPYLIARSDIHFNLSHSQNTVFCAVSDSEVGCDVQQKRSIAPGIADRFFTPAENEFLSRQNTREERDQLFFRLWTLKESFIKANGKTLKDLHTFSVFIHNDCIWAESPEIKSPFYFKEFSMPDDNFYACCCKSDGFAELICVNLYK